MYWYGSGINQMKHFQKIKKQPKIIPSTSRLPEMQDPDKLAGVFEPVENKAQPALLVEVANNTKLKISTSNFLPYFRPTQ